MQQATSSSNLFQQKKNIWLLVVCFILDLLYNSFLFCDIF